MRRAAPALLPLTLAAAMPASAAERVVAVTGFDRIRIETPVEVRVSTGGSPGARLSGDPAALDGVDLRQTGMTLVVARQGGNARAAGPVTVTLATPALAGASVLGGARVTIDRIRGPRVDLSVGGAGTIAVASLDAEQLSASVIGDGAILLNGGSARVARLTASGAGGIAAGGMQAGELTVRLDGTGEIAAAARYTATIANTGLGRVAVTGTPRCVIRAATGPVDCGTTPPR